VFLNAKAGGILVYIIIIRIYGNVSHIGNCGYPASHEVLVGFARKLADNKDTEVILIP
jgi:hypothetical protein